ncbi:hypothetical protein PBCV1_a621aR [Paramecium bursaria Chlorella virus 1]|uniref:Uncharacterized protein n=1 Tax=Paramecium bursaria Chlorella virus 1 TaxID=10506 RepID=F8TU70_PBCV1|nr:hypothetical protein PBCV1_a621aR [Paramecium bursaria Chlorella virus 1]AEI70131.1 hypothetical protein [Paramecium bursaria Chlorella virus 1]
MSAYTRANMNIVINEYTTGTITVLLVIFATNFSIPGPENAEENDLPSLLKTIYNT